MPRVSRKQADENHAAVLDAAARLFRAHGIKGVSVPELMAEAGLIHVVASPRMTVAEGQTGYMLAGQELPIQSVAIVSNVQTATTEYKPVGVQLYITPQAMGPDSVKLHAISIVSAVQGFAPLPQLTSVSARTARRPPPIGEPPMRRILTRRPRRVNAGILPVSPASS